MKRKKKKSKVVPSKPPVKKEAPPRKHLFLVVSAALLLLFGYGSFRLYSKYRAGQKSITYNVVLLSIDTLRADYLRPYDSRGVEVPHMQQLAKNGILFKKTVSQIPYTLPSHTSLLTGLHPLTHGVKDNVQDVLRKDIHTVAESFLSHGYDTAGFIGSMVLNRSTGLGRGFEYYDDFLSRADVRGEDLGAIERRAQDVLNSFEHWYGKRTEQKPFFAFVHFYDPHDPYDPPPPFFPKEDSFKERYKGEIRYVDYVVGNLMDFLHQNGLWENTILLLTSDHGEMLQEHGEMGHGFFLYQSALAVPLMMHIPGMAEGRTIPDVVELVDVPSTLLDLCHLPVPKEMQGESLVPLIEGEGHKKNRFALSESYFASIQLGVSPISSIQDATYKYINSPRPELYDLKNDPSEDHNLIEEKKTLAQQMKQKLDHFGQMYRRSEPSEQRKITAEQEEQFAALGYLGGHFAEEKWDYGKDPKDYIDDWTRILQATDLTQQGKFDEALTILDRIEKETGNSTEPILVLRSKCYSGLGRFDEAEKTLKQIGDTPVSSTFLAGIYATTGREEEADREYQKALQQRFSYFVLYNYVLFLKRSGRVEEALDVIKKVQETRPTESQARPMLAEIYMLLQQTDKAEEMMLALMHDRPWEAKWYIQLASLYQSQKQPQKGLQLLLQHYDQFSNNGEYLLRLGILFRSMGDSKQELAAFQKMIQTSRDDPRGYFYLAKAVLDYQQNAETAIELSKTGFSLRPDPSLQIFGHYILSDAYASVGNKAESQKEVEAAQQLERSTGMSTGSS